MIYWFKRKKELIKRLYMLDFVICQYGLKTAALEYKIKELETRLAKGETMEEIQDHCQHERGPYSNKCLGCSKDLSE